jgi:hypothetical protein
MYGVLNLRLIPSRSTVVILSKSCILVEAAAVNTSHISIRRVSEFSNNRFKGYIYMRFRIYISWFLVILLFGCKSDTTGPGNKSNLLINSRFEINNIPSLAGWTALDSSYIHLSTDVPIGIPGYSIIITRLDSSYLFPINSIYQNLPVNPGHHHYKFSCWVKTTTGSATFEMSINGMNSGRSMSDSMWHFADDVMDVEMSSTDTLTFRLLGGPFFWDSRPFHGQAWFCNPSVEIID